MIKRTFLLALLVSLARSDETDELIKNILEKDLNATTDKQGNNKNLKEFVDENGVKCICVPYYQCLNGSINTDGTGLLNIRMGASICGDFIEQCCKEPTDDIITPPRYVRKGCGQRHAEGVGFRITGDNISEAQFGEFPWMVALMKLTPLEDGINLMVYKCGGALINEKVVLTAAHCVTNKNDDNEVVVRAGEWDTQRTNEIFPHQNRKVVQTIIHPGFNGGNLWNDFALLVVDTPFTFTDNIDTICLPPPGVVSVSRECYATGWGKDHFGKKGKYQVILKKVDLPMVPKEKCISILRTTRLGRYFRLHDSFVCAGGIIGKDTCKGDGGSPLVCPVEGKPGTYEVTGLVSWGIGCRDETPGVYASIAHARPWIDKVMAELGFSPQ